MYYSSLRLKLLQKVKIFNNFMFNYNDPPKIELSVLLSVNWVYYAALKV